MLLLSTSSLQGYGLHKIFQLVAKSGYDGVNLDLELGDYDIENPEYIAELVKSTGVKVQSITAYERKMSKESVDKVIEIADILKVTPLFFYPPHRSDKEGNWFHEYLPKMKAKRTDLTFGIINVEPKTILFFIPEYKDATLTSIKKLTGETALHITNVDPTTGVDLLKTFSVLGNSIRNVYLSDKNATKGKLLPGKGDVPLESLLIKLKENKYPGLFTLQVNPKELGAGKDEVVLEKLEEARKYFQKYFK
jgi:sugar phosphate isomerase/epimerase